MNADEWTEIRRLHAEGTPIKQIAATLTMSRNTVRRALSFSEPPPDHRPRRGSTADAYDDVVRDLLHESPGLTVEQIADRIGWDRSRTTLARRVAALRRDDASPAGPRTPAPGLPCFATDFIGRRPELAAVRARLGRHRLVTIAGPGGVGKTRLAVQAAHEYRRAFTDGVRLVELSTLRDPALVGQAVVDALGLVHHGGSAATAVAAHVRDAQLLLVLDNCEHVRDAAAELVEFLLRSTSRLRILVTSRELLDLPGEDVEFLEPLPVGGEDDDQDTAVALFVSRAREVLSDFSPTPADAADVRRICRRLDGIPLAIELACIRLRVLSLRELADRLDRGLTLLSSRSRRGQERHASLEAAIGWSYELCSEEQRLMWARCSVFAGGFDAGMAAAVCADEDLPEAAVLDCLYDLVGKSVLRRVEVGGRVRFRVLEPIREYGQAALTEADRAALDARLVAWCRDLVERSVADWMTVRQAEVAARLQADLPTVRAALQAALAPGTDDLAAATDLLAGPWFLWACGFSSAEHVVWLERLLVSPGLTPGQRVRALATLGMVQVLIGDRAAAAERLAGVPELADDVGEPTAASFALNAQGLSAFYDGELSRARELLLDAVARYEDAPATRVDLPCTARVHLGLLACFAERTDEAAELFATVRHVAEDAGEAWMLSYAVYGEGLVALGREDYDRAAASARESLRLQSGFADAVGTPLALELLGWAEAGAGSAERAAVLLGASSARWGAFGQQLYGSEAWIERRSRFVRRVSRELGPARFAACQRRGAAMTLGELTAFAAGTSAPERDDRPSGPGLTGLSRREREVAAHVAHGLSNKQIAAKLVLSHRTVEGHVEHILQKLGMDNRTQLVAAIASGTRVTT
ncbi:LuxR C-terminal-related transcriptional regulator [Actinomycetospora sp. OC33-EN08]|uniref:LuxR C-terminal-related transcriptional regulator n=1 Tax=Actinomycetospora aurantiaca TaxID=3129233 RepID=A0ABU8MKC8_9PSEU